MHTRTLLQASSVCPRRTVIHPPYWSVHQCVKVCDLISAACQCLSLSLSLALSLSQAAALLALCCFAVFCFALLCLCLMVCLLIISCSRFCLFPSFLSFPDLHIHSSYLLHLPFLHWEWQAGIPLTNSVFCTQQTPVRTLRGQSSAQHLPLCVCVYVCVFGSKLMYCSPWCMYVSSCSDLHTGQAMSCFSPLGFVWPWFV